MRYSCVTHRPQFRKITYFSKEVVQLPAQSVLGILHFSFHPGVNVLELSQPASLLWSRSLEFVSTIPGFQGLSWAPVNDASPYQQIIVLIQWISLYSWKLFQQSLGFSMMIGYISMVANRCIQLGLPVDVSGFACHLELVSFRFSTMEASTQLGKKADFKSKWETAFSPLLDLAIAETGLITACGEWLQNDYDSEDHFFIGLLFWRSSHMQDSPQLLRKANTHNISDRLEELVEDSTEVISALTSQLNHISSDFVRSRLHDPFPDPLQFQTNHQLFKVPVEPRYNATESTNPDSTDKFHLESIIQAQIPPDQRIAVAPAGVWYPMGTISQHHLPRQPFFTPEPNMEMISFFAEAGNERASTAFSTLRKRLWQLGDCPQLVWGKNQSCKDGEDHISLFISMCLFIKGAKVLAMLILLIPQISKNQSTPKRRPKRKLHYISGNS